MEKHYIGVASIRFEGLDLGSTLRDQPVKVSSEVIKQEIRTDYNKGTYDEIQENTRVLAEFSLPYTLKNLERFPKGGIIEGTLEFVNQDANDLNVVIPNASITIEHKLNFKGNAYHSIQLTAVALEVEGEEKIIINGEFQADDLLYLRIDGSNKMEGDLDMDGYTIVNYCPFPIGYVMITMSTEEPTLTYPGTTWDAIGDGRFLMNDHSIAPETPGGSDTISTAQLPSHHHVINHNHIASFLGTALAGHTHARGTMDITGSFPTGSISTDASKAIGAFSSRADGNREQTGSSNGFTMDMIASRSWTGATTSVSGGTPSGSVTVNQHEGNSGDTGSGEVYKPLNISCRMWVRRT